MVDGGFCDGIRLRHVQEVRILGRRDEYFLERNAGTERASSLTVPMTNSFRDLEVWRQSMLLVEEIYAASKHFPTDERFGLTAQLRRAAISIPSNIAERARRTRRRPYLNHLDIALGSQGEVDVQVELAKRLGFCSESDHQRMQERIDRIGRMLHGLITSLQPGDHTSSD